jgi:hypothetical protein
MAAIWDFTSLVDSDRIARLQDLKSFDEVIREMVPRIKILGYEPEPFRGNRLRGCTRASFLLFSDHVTYDAFFNSPAGYRAQYCHGRETGERANRWILNALKDALIEFAKPNVNATFSIDRIAASLAADDAKIWIDENEPSSFPSNDFEIHINYGPWVDRAKRANASQEEEFIGAIRGVLAPSGTRLEVKGGWIDSNGSEQHDPFKDNRSEMIALNGFA